MEKTLVQRQGDCIRIVLFGPESTGKTTLARHLATRFNTLWVPEYMRVYLQEKWDIAAEKISKEDLLPIARGQIAQENTRVDNANKFLFCDTNLLEIQVYCEYYYDGWCPEEIKEAASDHTYNFYFLTDIDVPWQPDDLRDRPNDRSTIFSNFEIALVERNLPYAILTGSLEQRINTAKQTLRQLF